ncbi:phosphatase PAP2 family protein [Dactylosporangium sp. CA-092794]|uniref:phosphatase PAP2 family protein n=1 Tax=Dactylosporangium sp. CA-092794 TaxID=3239929 RepID=UPI003D9154EE
MHRLDGSAAGIDEAEPMTITCEAPAARVPLARQALVGLGAVTGYLLVRGAVEAADTRALDHARDVAGLERSAGLGGAVAALRDGVSARPAVASAFEWLYTYGHWVAAGAVLVWLARRHAGLYYVARDALLVSAAAALIVLLVYPVTPPDAGSDFAALPSLRAGSDLIIALAIGAAARGVWARLAGTGLAALLAASVVLTGHHYVVDALAGAGLAGAAWLYLTVRRRPAALRGYAGWDGLDLH